MRLSGFAYYARSILRLLLNITPRSQVLALFLGRSIRQPLIITLRGSGLKFRVRTAMDVWVIKETCLDRDYERGVMLQDGWAIVDIGAGLGDFSAYAAQHSPNGCVYAYEPFPESFALLQQNLELNQLRNVVVRPYAVADVAGKQYLNVGMAEAVQHTTMQSGAQVIEVPAITLEQLFDDHHLTMCDFLKIDVEGAEYSILMNAGDGTLRKIRRLALEYHDHTAAGKHEQLVEFLRARDFQVQARSNLVHRHLGYLYAMNNEQ
jgi:FkbM family methyltransferase